MFHIYNVPRKCTQAKHTNLPPNQKSLNILKTEHKQSITVNINNIYKAFPFEVQYILSQNKIC